MLSFISVPLTTFIVAFFIYKLFELFACRKERLYIVEHMHNIPENANSFKTPGAYGLNLSFSALRWGALLMGVGAGLLVGFFIQENIPNMTWWKEEVIYGSCVLLLGGFGLIVAFIIELWQKKQK